MLNMSLTDTMFSLASSITSAILPRSDKILREASIVIIKMIGLTPPPSQPMIECLRNHIQNKTTSLQKKPKIRKCLKIHRNGHETDVCESRNNFAFQNSFIHKVPSISQIKMDVNKIKLYFNNKYAHNS